MRRRSQGVLLGIIIDSLPKQIKTHYSRRGILRQDTVGATVHINEETNREEIELTFNYVPDGLDYSDYWVWEKNTASQDENYPCHWALVRDQEVIEYEDGYEDERRLNEKDNGDYKKDLDHSDSYQQYDGGEINDLPSNETNETNETKPSTPLRRSIAVR